MTDRPLPDEPLRCENCGEPMSEHDRMAHCAKGMEEIHTSGAAPSEGELEQVAYRTPVGDWLRPSIHNALGHPPGCYCEPVYRRVNREAGE